MQLNERKEWKSRNIVMINWKGKSKDKRKGLNKRIEWNISKGEEWKKKGTNK